MNKYQNYLDYIMDMYYTGSDEPLPDHFVVRDVTFQVTDACQCACTYCYEGNKGTKMMTKDVAKRAVDILFEMYDKDEGTFINKSTKGIILDFIGGEPLLNIEVIDYICSYFVDTCIERHHPWLYTWKASMISNGAAYFDEKVQKFFDKFKGNISFGITIDGPKEVHDSCRVYHDGRGNFDDAYAAQKHFREHFYTDSSTKVTISPDNLTNLNKIVDFFVADGIDQINANCVFEAEWTYDHAKKFYFELKQMADKLIRLDGKVAVSLFREDSFRPMSSWNNENWCGGNGQMLAFGVDGTAYPCVRYMPISLGNDIKPVVVGNVYDGVFTTEATSCIEDELTHITRRSQSTDECWDCTIADGCAWCSAWNYQCMGSANKRCTRICPMHKARALANVYYWNRLYHNQHREKRMPMYISKAEALKIIPVEEYETLLELTY